jgi:signal transduction histidine kinase
MSAVPVFNSADGSLAGYRGAASDITELTRREESLRGAKEIAESASRAKSHFLANMSHELRTPLNAIMGFADIMRMGLLGPIENSDYRSYVRDMHKSAEHLLNVINDILDVARIETGEFALQEAVCNTEELFDSAARLIRDRLQGAGLKLGVDLPAKLPRLNADKRKIKQILMNLLSNAVKFTPQGGHVAMSAAVNRQGQLEIVVSDTGIGIPPDKIDLVMQPFAQVDSGLERKFDGVGLGLSLSRALARLHGGDVRLESELGKGTRAIFTLPKQRLIDGNHLTAIK